MNKKFSAIVKDKETGKKSIITSEYASKKLFTEDIRANGYSVDENKVKENSEFERIMSETDCNPWDWK